MAAARCSSSPPRYQCLPPWPKELSPMHPPRPNSVLTRGLGRLPQHLMKRMGSIVRALVARACSHLQADAQNLGSAAAYAVLAGSAVTNTGPTLITGDLGVHPGT